MKMNKDGGPAAAGQTRFYRFLPALVLLQALIILGLGIALLFACLPKSQPAGPGLVSGDENKYLLYIGTNDRETYLPRMPLAEARGIVNDICKKYVDGFSVQALQGAWEDEQGVWTSEDTLVYSISGADEGAIIAIMDEALQALNQSSILVEKDEVRLTYYGGGSRDE